MEHDNSEHAYFGQTVLHPVGLMAVILLGIATILLPRRYAVWPLVIMACFVAPAQRIVIGAFDFNMLRMIIMAGWIRVLMRNEQKHLVWRPIDTLMVAWAFAGATIFVLQWGTMGAFINRLGFLYDAIGAYFLFRCLIRDWSDYKSLAWGVTIIAIPMGAAFLMEWFTARNVFATFGGVPEVTKARQGRLRAQGAFPHPIIAGTFWATLLPLIVAQWWDKRSAMRRPMILLGIGGACWVVIASASSTPLFAAIAGVGAGFAFYFRHNMRTIRWGILLGLISLHLVMNKPVWHLMSRTDLIAGSTGWHRYFLFDQWVNRWSEWWLLGTRSTAHWGHQLFDVTNQYVLESVRGGLVTVVLFVLVIGYCFMAVGRLWRAYRDDPAKMALAWALGVALFVHVMAFFAVSYFGQIRFIWYLLLATITSLDAVRVTAAQKQPAGSPLAEPGPRRVKRRPIVPRPTLAAHSVRESPSS